MRQPITLVKWVQVLSVAFRRLHTPRTCEAQQSIWDARQALAAHLETVVSTTDDIAKRNCTEKTCLETVVSTTDEGAQPQAPVAFTEPTTVQYLPKEATQPLRQRNEHSARAAARMHARVDPLERRARALQDCKKEK